MRLSFKENIEKKTRPSLAACRSFLVSNNITGKTDKQVRRNVSFSSFFGHLAILSQVQDKVYNLFK